MCPACATENRQGAKFCDSCGGPLPRACVSCGTALRSTARFCDECGRAVEMTPSAKAPSPVPAAPLVSGVAGAGSTPKHLADKILSSRSALEGERKQETVLFSDCVGF